MDSRKYIVFLLLMFFTVFAKAQDNAFKVADSTSNALYEKGNWQQLLKAGNGFIKSGTDFLELRLKMGYAEFMQGNYAAALIHYNTVLRADSYNQTARYYAYLCNRYLNHNLNASYHSSFVDSTLLKKDNFELNSLDAESSFKNVRYHRERGNATYNRIGLSAFLFKKLELYQSVAYFKQDLYQYRPFSEVRYAAPDYQTEYFTRLGYALTGKLTLTAGYHYLYTDFMRHYYHSHISLLGLSYAGGYFDAGADFNLGTILKSHMEQYNASLALYPLGNLNLYFISRGSFHKQLNRKAFIYNQIAGFKVINRFWLESGATFGNQENYIDANGVYVYNSIDNTKLRLNETAYYQINTHALLQISYTYEKKQIAQPFKYDQHSISAGILWKF